MPLFRSTKKANNLSNKYLLEAKTCVESFNDGSTYVVLPETLKKFSQNAKGYQIVRNNNYNDIRTITLANLKKGANPFNDIVSLERQLASARKYVALWSDSEYEVLDETITYKNTTIRKFQIVRNGNYLDVRTSDLMNLKRGSNPFNEFAGGFDSNKSAWCYLLRFDTYIKFGISNKLDQRLKQHLQHNGNYQLLASKFYENGQDALEWENSIKKQYGGKYVTKDICPEGWTETLSLEKLSEIEKLI